VSFQDRPRPAVREFTADGRVAREVAGEVPGTTRDDQVVGGGECAGGAGGDRDGAAVGCVFCFVGLEGRPFDEAGVGGAGALGATLFGELLVCERERENGGRERTFQIEKGFVRFTIMLFSYRSCRF
jgi:hypothetical protein